MKLNSRMVSALGALSMAFVISACGPATTVVGPAEPSASPSVTVSDPSDPKVVEKVATEVMVELDFTKDGIKVNKDVDQAAAEKIPAGSATFSDKHLTSPTITAAFLASGSPKSNVVVNDALANAKENKVEVTKAQLADKANWVAVSTTDSVAWSGNTYHVGGVVRKTSDVRIDDPGSVIMVFVPPSQVAAGKVTWVFFLRGACANPQTKPPKPVTPPKPGEKPKCPPEWPHGTYPICKDDPDKDPQSQGNVPSPFVKDKPSDDNASEVAKPPEKPSDSGNGIPATSSPRATPSPTATSSAPPSGPGNGTPGPAPTSPAPTASGASQSSAPVPSGTPCSFGC